MKTVTVPVHAHFSARPTTPQHPGDIMFNLLAHWDGETHLSWDEDDPWVVTVIVPLVGVKEPISIGHEEGLPTPIAQWHASVEQLTHMMHGGVTTLEDIIQGVAKTAFVSDGNPEHREFSGLYTDEKLSAHILEAAHIVARRFDMEDILPEHAEYEFLVQSAFTATEPLEELMSAIVTNMPTNSAREQQIDDELTAILEAETPRED